MTGQVPLWLDQYFSDISAGLVGSLIVIFSIDRIIRRNKEEERSRREKIALRRLRTHVLWHVVDLLNMYKAVIKDKPLTLPSTLEDVFNEDFYKEIGMLDLMKEAPVIPRTIWLSYLGSQIELARRNLKEVIDSYSVYLEIELVELVERCSNSHFSQLMIQLEDIPLIDKEHHFKRQHYNLFLGVEKLVREHITMVLSLVEYMNKRIDSPIELKTLQDRFRDDVAPLWGSGRIDYTGIRGGPG